LLRKKTEILKTCTEIKKALGDDYAHLIEKYDIKWNERKQTDRWRKILQPPVCAACGRSSAANLVLQAAHITPLAECAVTAEENLLLLCKEIKITDPPGCHRLFDLGYCSVREMQECRIKWLKGLRPYMRDKMLTLRREWGPQNSKNANYKKALGELRILQKPLDPQSEDWNVLQIQISELTRRRAKKNILEKAIAEIARVDPAKLNQTLRSRYFYEKGYIDLLRGNLDRAFSYFLQGRTELDTDLDSIKNRWRWAAHTVLLAQVACLKRGLKQSVEWPWRKIRAELQSALACSESAVADAHKIITQSSKKSRELQIEYRDANRWVLNCLTHLVKPDIAEGRFSAAQHKLEIVNAKLQEMDVSSGWDATGRWTFLTLKGILGMKRNYRTSIRNDNEALAYLSRALVLVLGMRRAQPEGIRDLLISIAEALELQKDKMATRFREVGILCYDLSSWLHPYSFNPVY